MSSDLESVISVREAKRAIRRRIKVLREAAVGASPGVSLDSSAIVAAVRSLPEWESASTVLLYHPLPGEVDLIPLLGTPDKRMVLPLVVGDDLVLKEYHPGALVPGFAGILEPASTAPDVDSSEIGLAIIPGVAFDSECHRLGRGRGFYDRLLPSLGCPLVGVAFDWQMVEAVPCDPWDFPLDAVATGAGIFRKEKG